VGDLPLSICWNSSLNSVVILGISVDPLTGSVLGVSLGVSTVLGVSVAFGVSFGFLISLRISLFLNRNASLN